MCNPALIAGAGFAVSTASTIGSVIAQSQAQKAVQAHNTQQAAFDRETARLSYDQVERRRQQEAAAASQALFEGNIENMQAAETAKVSAANAGVRGLSVDALMRDIYGVGDRYTDTITQNFEGTNFQLGVEKDNIYRRQWNSRANMPTPPQVDYFGALTNIAGSGYSSYRDYLKLKG